jgi:DNA polymerase-1
VINLADVVATDSETHLIQDGLLAPPGVCWSFADQTQGTEIVEEFDAGLRRLEGLLRSNAVLAGANIAYDFAVACAESRGGRYTGRPDLLPLIFEKYERGEVFDVLIAIALDAIAGGHLFKDPSTGKPLRHAPTAEQRAAGKQGKVSKRYSLEIATRLLLGRENAKANDEYRTRYHELEWLPMAQWPTVAVQYPKDDARNTFDDAAALITKGRNLGPMQRHPWDHQTHEARAAWAMHLACVHGLRTDGAAVQLLAGKVETAYQNDRATFRESGLLRVGGAKDGKKNTAAIKKRVVEAYALGHTEPCTAEVTLDQKVKRYEAGAVVRCNAGKVPSPKTGNLINCKACGGSGLKYPAALPLTDKGGVSTARDTLSESGDPLLEDFALVSETEKLRGTYIPFLRVGVSKPINVRSNVLVESGRASYDGLIQLLPRGGGIRECIVARTGPCGFEGAVCNCEALGVPLALQCQVLCSVDYAALELCTLAQVCLWVVGESRMAEAINAAKDPGVLHTLFGAKLLGVDPATFKALVKAKDKNAVFGRFNAKAANFGFPGLMGPAKLTIAKRKEGIRFCVTSGRAPTCHDCQGPCKCMGMDKHCPERHCRRCFGRGAICGIEKVTEWNDRPIPPTCLACIEVATELRNGWFEQWPEIREYFKWVKAHDGVSDGYATIESPGTGYLRGGLNASSLANHSFQHLAAKGAKHALWKTSRECYTDPASPLWSTRPVIFAHDEILSEIPWIRRHEGAHRQAQIQRDAMREFVPDVYCGAEPAIMRRWFKEADTLIDPATGKLAPWSPEEAKRIAAVRKALEAAALPPPQLELIS